jgi:hypothetical protein
MLLFWSLIKFDGLIFPFFSRFLRICNQSLQKVPLRATKKLYYKIPNGYKKTQNFTPVSGLVKKF